MSASNPRDVEQPICSLQPEGPDEIIEVSMTE